MSETSPRELNYRILLYRGISRELMFLRTNYWFSVHWIIDICRLLYRNENLLHAYSLFLERQSGIHSLGR